MHKWSNCSSSVIGAAASTCGYTARWFVQDLNIKGECAIYYVRHTALLARTRHWCFYAVYLEGVLAGIKFYHVDRCPDRALSAVFMTALRVRDTTKKKVRLARANGVPSHQAFLGLCITASYFGVPRDNQIQCKEAKWHSCI